MATQPLGIQQDDVVRLVETGELAIVDHVGGETSEEEEDDDADSDGSFEHLPLFESDSLHQELQHHGVNSNSQGHEEVRQRQHFIRQYDDDGNADEEEDDNVEDEHRNDPNFVNQNDESQGVVNTGRDSAAPLDALDDEEPFEDVPVGSVRVLLVESGHDAVVTLDKVSVEDRSFIPGEIVHARLRNQPSLGADSARVQEAQELSSPPHSQTQGATITAVTKNLLVRKVCPQSLPPSRRHGARAPEQPAFEISSDRLGFISGLRDGCFVVLNNWMGRVTSFNEFVDVRFSDGSVCQVHGHPSELLPADVEDDTFLDDVEGVYYPGQFVRAEPEVWRAATWLSGSYSRERIGAVVSVEVVDVGVDWMATKYTDEVGAEEETPPPDIVPARDLTPLGAFRALWWRVGDRGLYVGDVPGSVDSSAGSGPDLGSHEVDEDGEWEVVDSEEIEVSGNPDGQHHRSRPGAPRRRRSVSRSSTGRLTGQQQRLPRQTQNPTSGILDHGRNEHVVEVISTKTYLDLLWQDGSKSHQVPAVTVLRNRHLGAYDYFPGLFVSEAQDDLELDNHTAADPESELAGERNARKAQKRIGVVVRVNHGARTAVVRWQIGDKCEYGPDEEISVYELSEHGVYDIRLGDTVLRVPSQHQASASGGSSVTQNAWVGEVLGIGIGVLEVAWHNGGRESVTPDCLLVVGGDDEDGEMEEEDDDNNDVEESNGRDASEHWASDMFPPRNDNDNRLDNRREGEPLELSENWGDDEANNTQTPHASLATADNAKEQHVPLTVGQVVSQALEAHCNTPVLTDFDPQLVGRAAALEGLIEVSGTGRLTVQRVVEAAVRHGLAMSRGSFSPSSGTMWPETEYWSQLEAVLGDRLQIVLTRLGVRSVDDGTTVSLPNGVPVPIASAENNASSAASLASRSASSADVLVAPGPELSDVYGDIERFAVVDEIPMHQYSSGSSTDRPPSGGFASVVRKEWTRLSRHLPVGIFVHATESRLDLLRAAIVGPADTPYADVIFFFDILLPGDYPSMPPKVQFMSHGRRLNPNLYEDGKVCLSILGTWDGEGVEKWDPRNSNVLRVLLSLQAMVFVEEPYYNEAGYEKQVATSEGQANSRLYNESTLLLCLRHVVSTLRPGGAPRDFLDLMRLHYRRVGAAMLERCRALIAEPAASPGNSASVSDTAWRRGCALKVDETSVGFKRSLASLLPRVQLAFDDLGAEGH